MNLTAVESAKYSLFLEIESDTSCVTIGAKMAKRIPINKRIAPALLSLSLVLENHKLLRKIWAIIEIIPIITAVNVIYLISKFAIWDISWAITPSSSCLSNFSRQPEVTQMTACSGLLPDANAFICFDSITYSLGIGKPDARDIPSAA